MAENDENTFSPTVTKVLDAYLAALHADNGIDKEAADRLDELLRKGKVPKTEEIDAALFPSVEDDKP